MKLKNRRRGKKESSKSIGEPLSNVNFELYGDSLEAMGVSHEDAERNVKRCSNAFSIGGRETRKKIVQVINTILEVATQPRRELEPVRKTTESDMDTFISHGSPERR